MAAFCGFPPAGTRPQGTRWHLFHTTGLLRLTRPLSAARTHRLSTILPGLPAPSLHPAVLLLLLAQPHCAGRFLPPVPAGSALGIAARARAQPGGGSSCSASPVSPEQGREGAPAPPAAGPGVRFLLKKRKNEKKQKSQAREPGVPALGSQRALGASGRNPGSVESSVPSYTLPTKKNTQNPPPNHTPTLESLTTPEKFGKNPIFGLVVYGDL